MTASGPALTRTFDPHPSSVRSARRFVTDSLEALDAGAVVDTAALLLSELVTNGVLHARTQLTVEIEARGARIRVTVRDGNTVLPSRRAFSELAGSGRGLHLVDSIADAWGVEEEAGGKRVWFELDRSASGLMDFDLDSVDSL